ncbi:MAG: VWA domain-containing protein, partial [Mycobacterium sp.]
MIPVLLLALATTAMATQRPRQAEMRASSGPYQLTPVFRAEESSVPVEVVVRDPKGMPVAGLTRGSFRILDDGHTRPLASFTVETAPAPAPGAGSGSVAPPPLKSAAAAPGRPRSIALYFDDVNTTEADLDHARNAATRFVREALGSNDSVAVVTGSGLQEQTFTTSRARLLAAIADIHAHPRAVERATTGCLRITPYQAYLIVNHLDPGAMAAAMANQGQCDEQNGIVTTST